MIGNDVWNARDKERIAMVAHNEFMADEWDQLPAEGIERAAWLIVADQVLREVTKIMDEAIEG